MGGPYDEWHSTVLRLLRRLLFPAWDSAKRRYPPDLWNRDVFDEFVDTMEVRTRTAREQLGRVPLGV